jgi:hypothetical protein
MTARRTLGLWAGLQRADLASSGWVAPGRHDRADGAPGGGSGPTAPSTRWACSQTAIASRRWQGQRRGPHGRRASRTSCSARQGDRLRPALTFPDIRSSTGAAAIRSTTTRIQLPGARWRRPGTVIVNESWRNHRALRRHRLAATALSASTWPPADRGSRRCTRRSSRRPRCAPITRRSARWPAAGPRQFSEAATTVVRSSTVDARESAARAEARVRGALGRRGVEMPTLPQQRALDFAGARRSLRPAHAVGPHRAGLGDDRRLRYDDCPPGQMGPERLGSELAALAAPISTSRRPGCTRSTTTAATARTPR